MTWVLLACAVMLSAAALLLVVRVTIGPTILDRTMALDVMMSVMVCAIAVLVAHTERTDPLPVLLVLAAVGFVGSVSVARYASGVDDVEAEREEQDS